MHKLCVYNMDKTGLFGVWWKLWEPTLDIKVRKLLGELKIYIRIN